MGAATPHDVHRVLLPRRWVKVLVSPLIVFALIRNARILPQVLRQDETNAISQGVTATSKNLPRTNVMRSAAVDGVTDNNAETSTRSRYAYAYLVAGCDPAKPTFMGYIYNILVSANILRTSGSTMDIIALIRMATATQDSTLPSSVSELLEKAGVIVRYIPKVKTDNFYTAMMDKFRILEMVEYRRVVFMDGDVMPLCNLDYLFHLSDDSETNNTTLAPNVILAFKISPAHGGFFMLSPKPGDYDKIQEIITAREKQGSKFDVVHGWGHKIEPPDEWVGLMGWKRGTKWDYYGAMADQGLLYHWVKYVLRDVSIVNSVDVERWGVDSNHSQNSTLIRKETGLLSGCTPKAPNVRGLRAPPIRDYIHFTSKSKPWMGERGKDVRNISTVEEANTEYELWFHVLRKLLVEFNHTADVDSMQLRATLGLFPTDAMVQKKVDAEKRLANEGLNNSSILPSSTGI